MNPQSDHLHLAEQFISDLLRELHADPARRIDAYKLDPAKQEGIPGYLLIVIRGARAKTTFIPEAELLIGYGAEAWEERIRERVEGFLHAIH